MRYGVVDLEATCWEERGSPERMEIIEIGAVLLASSRGPAEREHGSFVRPVESPLLSDFCTRLTSIRQQDVDGAPLGWKGPAPRLGEHTIEVLKELGYADHRIDDLLRSGAAAAESSAEADARGATESAHANAS